MNETQQNADLVPPCRNLRNKEMYYQPVGQEEDDFASGIFWCGRTQESFGPDGQPVGRRECCIGRGCFVD